MNLRGYICNQINRNQMVEEAKNNEETYSLTSEEADSLSEYSSDFDGSSSDKHSSESKIVEDVEMDGNEESKNEEAGGQQAQ